MPALRLDLLLGAAHAQHRGGCGAALLPRLHLAGGCAAACGVAGGWRPPACRPVRWCSAAWLPCFVAAPLHVTSTLRGGSPPRRLLPQNGPRLSLWLTLTGILLGFLSLFWSFGAPAALRCVPLPSSRGGSACAAAAAAGSRLLSLLSLPPGPHPLPPPHPPPRRLRAAEPQAARLPGSALAGRRPQDPAQRRHRHAGEGVKFVLSGSAGTCGACLTRGGAALPPQPCCLHWPLLPDAAGHMAAPAPAARGSAPPPPPLPLPRRRVPRSTCWARAPRCWA